MMFPEANLLRADLHRGVRHLPTPGYPTHPLCGKSGEYAEGPVDLVQAATMCKKCHARVWPKRKAEMEAYERLRARRMSRV